MNSSHKNSRIYTGTRLTQRAFILYFLCILLPITIVISALHIYTDRKNYLAAKQECQIAAQTINSRLNEKLSGITATVNSLFNARWYTHYRNIAGIYADEFDALSKKEISTDLKNRMIGMDFVEEIVIITPEMDSVITSQGWFTLNKYDYFYGDICIETDENITHVTAAYPGKNVVYLLQDPVSRRDSTVICVILSRSMFERYLSQMKSDSVNGFHVTLEDNVLCEYGEMDNSYVCSHKGYGTPKYNLDIAFSLSFGDSHSRTTYFLSLLSAVLASVLIATFLTRRNVRPVEQLLKKYVKVPPKTEAQGSHSDIIKLTASYIGTGVEDACEMLDGCFQDVSEEHRLLKQNCESFTLLLQSMRRELLFSLLTTRELDMVDTTMDKAMMADLLPWIAEGLPFILVLAELKTYGSDWTEEQLNQTLAEESDLCGYVHFDLYKMLAGEAFMLFWLKPSSDGLPDEEKHSENLNEMLTRHLGNDYHIEISPICRDISACPDAYKNLQRQIREKTRSGNTLPLSMQNLLISRIQAGKVNECRSLLEEAQGDYDPDSVMLLMMRLSQEYGIENRTAAESFSRVRSDSDAAWKVLYSFASDICRQVNASKKKNFDDTASLIKHEIDENFRNCEMSIKYLSERFNVDGSFISRVFKERYDISFTDYLLELRMQLAKRLLLDEKDLSATAIAAEVGYSNYLSFKRAFQRYQGVLPNEYRTQGM